MKASLKEVMSQFYADGVPTDLLPRSGSLAQRRNNATVVAGMRRTGKTYFAYPVSLRTDSLARLRTNPDKYYLIDTGLIGANKVKDDAEKGWLLENFVFNALRRGNPKIEYYITKSGKEVDFLVTDSTSRKRRLVQVTWEMSDTATFDREHSALVEAKAETGVDDCVIITWEDERELDHGIKVVPVWKWALNLYSSVEAG